MTLVTYVDSVELLYAALLDALDDASVTNLLASSTSLYRGAPEMKTSEAQTDEPYVVVSSPSADDSALFASVSGLARFSIDVWARDEPLIPAISAALAARCHRVRFTISGVRHFTGTYTWIATLRDTGRRRLWHGVARYEGQVAN